MPYIDVAINLLAYDMTAGAFSGITSRMSGMLSLASPLNRAFYGLSSTQRQMGETALFAAGAMDLLSVPVKAGVVAAADLESELVRLEIATQSSSDAMPVLTQAVNDLAIKTVYGSSEAANAFERMSEMGFNVSQILYGMGASADEYKQHAYDATEATKGLGMQGLVLGQAMGTDAVQGATLLGSALNTFKDQGLEATDAANLLAGAYFNGVPSAEALQQAIAMTGAQASTAGIPLQDLLTTLDLLTQSGMSASSAGASLNYMIQSMVAPTQKQAKELASLGIMTVNAGDAYDTFRNKLLKIGAVTSDQLKLWDGSVTGLHHMYEAAQQAGMVPLDEDFNQWALKAGLLSNNLFDASGKFVGMKDAIQIIDEAMKGMTVEQKMDALGELFNVRSGRAARILTDVNDFATRYDDIFKKIGKTDVTEAARKQLDTLRGSWDAFKDSVLSSLAMAFLPFLGVLTNILTIANNLLQTFMNLPSSVQGVVGIFLIAAFAAAALATAVAGAAFFFALIDSLGISLMTIFPPVAAVIALIGTVAVVAAAGWFIMTNYGKQLGDAMKSLWEHLKPVRDIIGALGAPLEGIRLGFVQLGTWISSTFAPTWKDIKKDFLDFWHTIQDNLKPAFDDMKRSWHDMQKALDDAKPGIDLIITVFKFLAIVIGVSVVMSIGFLIGVFVGLAKAFAGLVGGIAMMVAGIVEIFSGFVEFTTGFWGGFFNILNDLFHGRMDKLNKDVLDAWEHMKNGIKNIAGGIVTTVLGFFYGLGMGLWGLVSGFVETVIHWFQHLFDVLVGHSIVPDLINKIIEWFAGLPKKAASAVGGIISSVGGVFNNLASSATGWMSHFASNILNGLSDLVGKAGQKAKDIANAIQHFLGHSRPAGGPMADDDQWMTHFMLNMANGMDAGLPHLRSRAEGVASVLRNTFGGGAIFTPGMGAMQVNYAIQSANSSDRLQPVQINLGNERLVDAVLDHTTGQLKMNGVNRYGR